jgi:hypothetical protein
VLSDFVDRHNVRVIQLSRGFSFAAKTRKVSPSCRRSAENDLQRNDAIEALLTRSVNNTHSAAPQLFEQLVVTDCLEGRLLRGKSGSTVLRRDVVVFNCEGGLTTEFLRQRGDGPQLAKFLGDVGVIGGHSLDVDGRAGSCVGQQLFDEMCQPRAVRGTFVGVRL